MKKYSNKISLYKNNRGVWDIDTVKGCKYGMRQNSKGCYSSCYAYLIATRYGYDFSDSQLRYFESEKHIDKIVKKIKSIDMDFVRIGVTGDPSECWEHTIGICEKLKPSCKKIVIITKHWEKIPKKLYRRIEKLDIIINTSISALDGAFIEHKLNEYNKLKSICKSVLRIVSCRFNTKNSKGEMYNHIQSYLFANNDVLDTVLRISKNHILVRSGIIELETCNFLSNKTTASIKNKTTYLGYCDNCTEMCGVNMTH